MIITPNVTRKFRYSDGIIYTLDRGIPKEYPDKVADFIIRYDFGKVGGEVTMAIKGSPSPKATAIGKAPAKASKPKGNNAAMAKKPAAKSPKNRIMGAKGKPC